jgi:hypothetical protein
MRFCVWSRLYGGDVFEETEAGDKIEEAREEWVYAVRRWPSCLHWLRSVEGHRATDILRNMPSDYEDPDPEEIWLIKPLWERTWQDPDRGRIIRNAVRCKKCGDVIESKAPDECVMCSCGACGVDGGLQYRENPQGALIQAAHFEQRRLHRLRVFGQIRFGLDDAAQRRLNVLRDKQAMATPYCLAMAR